MTGKLTINIVKLIISLVNTDIIVEQAKKYYV